MKETPKSIDATRLRIESETRHLRTETYFDDFRRKEETGGDVAEIFHENTKIQQVGDKFVNSIEHFTRAQHQTGGAFSTRPEKTDLPFVELPEASPPDASLSDAVGHRRSIREFERDPITVEELSTILGYGCGTFETGPAESETVDVESRGYPSAGRLYPIEPYVFVLDSEGIPTGIYYYTAPDHGLRVIEELAREPLLDRVEGLASAWQVDYETASVLFVLAGSFWNTKIKYGPRGYRFALFEAGHLMQNVQLVASALRLGTCSVGGLDEDEVDPLLDANGVDESTVYGCVIGTPAEGA